MPTPTALSINSYPAPISACEGFPTPPSGVLMDTDTSLPIPNKVITVEYNGNTLGTDITDINGTYTILNAYILEAGPDPGRTFTLTASFAGDATYDPCSTFTSITIQYCEDDEDLVARFWISKWRASVGIEADTYGALLCIDPNRLRSTNKGPIIFLLDDLNLSPGITEKSGVMRCQINDNAYPPLSLGRHPEGRVDMELLKEGTIWIQDDDEFWIGVQRGSDPGANEPHGAWNPSGGVDGEGAGRQWLMGGYVSKRYYRYGGNGDITAVIIGKDYMDVWKDQIFGTPSLPRNYTVATDIGIIAYQLVNDINSFQPVGWQYTRHPAYFLSIESNLAADYPAGVWSVKVEDASQFTWSLVGVPVLLMDSNSREIMLVVGIDYGNNVLYFRLASPPTSNAYTMAAGARAIEVTEIGIDWKKEFNQEAANNVMTDICDEGSYEWRIDYRKRVMLYPRTSAPLAPAIRFTTNIRNLPQIVMGDTTERITHVIVTDATISSIPPDIDAWCLNPDTWPDLSNNPRGYSAASMPAPANPADNTYADPTLIFDDEIASALCYQNELASTFILNLSIYRDGSGEIQYAQLHLDLREWTRLKFRFRHPTRIEPGTGNIYRLALHTGGASLGPAEVHNNRYQYYFGQGTQEVDTIDSNGWTEIELLLPEVDVNGDVIVGKEHGWTAHDAWDVVHGVWVPPDPTDINWVSIYVLCNEPNPGHGPGQPLLAPAHSGKEYLRVANPQYFASGSTRKTFQFPNTYVLEDSGDSEDVRIRVVGLWGLDNLELDKGVINDYTVPAGATVSVKAGWTICFSQFHFQRRLRYEAGTPTPPYRYRMMVAKEMESLNEAVAKADGIIAQEEGTMKSVKVLIDGDPRFEAGYRSRLYLDVDPFDNVSMFIDDIQYELGSDLDFRTTLTLGEGDRRSRELTELSVLDAHDRQLRNLGLGRSKTRVDK